MITQAYFPIENRLQYRSKQDKAGKPFGVTVKLQRNDSDQNSIMNKDKSVYNGLFQQPRLQKQESSSKQSSMLMSIWKHAKHFVGGIFKFGNNDQLEQQSVNIISEIENGFPENKSQTSDFILSHEDTQNHHKFKNFMQNNVIHQDETNSLLKKRTFSQSQQSEDIASLTTRKKSNQKLENKKSIKELAITLEQKYRQKKQEGKRMRKDQDQIDYLVQQFNLNSEWTFDNKVLIGAKIGQTRQQVEKWYWSYRKKHNMDTSHKRRKKN